MAIAAPMKRGMRNSERSSMGGADGLSAATNAANAATPTTKPAIAVADDQPRAWPLISAQVSPNMAAANRTIPGGSSLLAAASRDSSIRQTTATASTMQIGTLT